MEEYKERDCDSIHEDSSWLKEFRDAFLAQKSLVTSKSS